MWIPTDISDDYHMRVLDSLRDEEPNDSVNAISANGTIVGIACDNDNKKKAVIWRPKKNYRIEALESLTDGYNSRANAISADGGIIVGASYDALEWDAIATIWMQRKGAFSLTRLLKSTLPDETFLNSADRISPNGTIVTGVDDIGNKSILWKAYIPNVAAFEREGIPLPFLKDYFAQQPQEKKS